MNKKLLGISALLALVLAGCGNNGDSSSTPSNSAPSDPSTTSQVDPSDDSGDESGSSSETPAGPSFEFSKFTETLAKVGDVFEATITVSGYNFSMLQNETYRYLEGFGGVGLITPKVEQETEEEETTDPEALAELANRDINTDAMRRYVATRKADEEVEKEARYFRVFEDEVTEDDTTTREFEVQWGAVYQTKSEFLADSLSHLGDYFDDNYDEEEIYYVKRLDLYQTENAYVINSLKVALGLDVTNLNLAKVDFAYNNGEVSFAGYTNAALTNADVTITVASKDSVSDASLEAYLASFDAYPTSPIAFADAFDVLYDYDYTVKTDLSYMFGSSYDFGTTTQVVPDGLVTTFDGAYYNSWWKNYSQYGAGRGMTQGIVGIAEDGKAVESGYYKFGTPAGNSSINRKAASKKSESYASEDYFSYFEDTGYYYGSRNYWQREYQVVPTYLYDWSDMLASASVESEEAFIFDENATFAGGYNVVYEVAGLFESNDVVYDITLDFKNVDGSELTETSLIQGKDYLVSWDSAREIAITYAYDEEVNAESGEKELVVTGYTVYIYYSEYGGVYNYGGGWQETAKFLDDTFYGPVVNTITNIGSTAKQSPLTSVEKFLTEDLEDVVFGPETEEEFVLDPTSTDELSHTWNVTYSPDDLTPFFAFIDEEGDASRTSPVATVDSATGEYSAVKPGETTALALVGGAYTTADITVKGLELLSLDEEEIGDEMTLAPSSEEMFLVNEYALDEERTLKVESSDETVATVELDEDEPFVTITTLVNGTTTITVTATEPDGGTYTAKFKLTVTPQIKIDEDAKNIFLKTEETIDFDLSDSILGNDETTQISWTAETEGVVSITVDADDQTKATIAPVTDTATEKVVEGATVVTVSMEVDGETYSDSFKVSVSDSVFVGEFLFGADLGGATLINHADGESTVIDGDGLVTYGTWTTVNQSGIDLCLFDIEYSYEGNALCYMYDAAGDEVMLRAVYSYLDDEQATNYDYTYAKNVNIPLYSLRGDYYVQTNYGTFELLIFNDGQYEFYFNGKFSSDGENFYNDYIAADGIITVTEYQSVDQLTNTIVYMYYNQTHGWLIGIYQQNRDTVNDDFGTEEIVAAYRFTQYSLY